MANQTSKKTSAAKNEKKVIKNSMFLRTSHHAIFILLMILMSFLLIAFNDQIREGGQHVAIFFEEISLTNLEDNYKNNIREALTDYFSQRFTIEDKSGLNDQMIEDLSELKVSDELRDFHLDLLLIFNKIKLADQESDNDQYVQAEASLQSLSDDNSWLNY